jgi:SpoIIAA-like
MLTRIEGFADDVVAVRGTGLVTAEDYRAVLVPEIARAGAGGRKIRLLMDLGEGFEGYDTSALFADSTLGIGHLGSFERIAVVTDAEWLRRAIQLLGGLIPGEVRLFPAADAGVARQWIAAD